MALETGGRVELALLYVYLYDLVKRESSLELLGLVKMLVG
jgi:hypothetical protein